MRNDTMIRSVLLHLGTNMWDDFLDGPNDWAKSPEEEKIRPNPFGPDSRGKRSRYHSYLKCDDAVWKESVDRCATGGMNAVFIDIGEGVAFPSHLELAVKGTWSVEKIEPNRLKGFCMAPWAASIHDNRKRLLRGIDLASAVYQGL